MSIPRRWLPAAICGPVKASYSPNFGRSPGRRQRGRVQEVVASANFGRSF